MSEKRKEEAEVLHCIFAEDFEVVEPDSLWAVSILNKKAKLLFHLPPDYPESRPVPMVQSDDIDASLLLLDESFLDSDLVFEQGTACCYDWILAIEDHLGSRLEGAGVNLEVAHVVEEEALGQEVVDYYAADDDCAIPDEDYYLQFAKEQSEGLAKKMAKKNKAGGSSASSVPDIYHSQPFTEKKSTFQGHCACVKSKEDVIAVLNKLYENSKVKKATHNQYAYRFRTEGTLIADNEDDGEAQAGKKLAELLELKKVENVLVVVSRWYGGVLMGADRFKAIARAAGDVLSLIPMSERSGGNGSG